MIVKSSELPKIEKDINTTVFGWTVKTNSRREIFCTILIEFCYCGIRTKKFTTDFQNRSVQLAINEIGEPS
jgi:hypothetical protein